MLRRSCAAALLLFMNLWATPSPAQEARRRWEQMCQIRKDKFDLVLPQAMRDNGIDMWLVMMKEGHYDPLYDDLGRGYPGRVGYYIFTDRGGDRVERAALGIDGYMLEACGAYDIVGGELDVKKFVAERAPKRIGVNMSDEIGAADGLSHAAYLELTKGLGEPWTSRLTSAEKLVSDFRARRVASEVSAFSEAAHLSRLIAERALSNEVIDPGATTLEDVAWWMQDRLLERGVTSAFDMPSVYITGPGGIEDVSNRRVIQPGDLVVIDWGICLMNFCTDVKRLAYVLKPGEGAPPAGIQNAFNQALKVREIIRRTIKPGPRADEMLKTLNQKVAEAGFAIMETFNKTTDTPKTEVIIGCHSVGNLGHDIGPSIAWFNPLRLTFEIRPTNMFSIEFFAWTPAVEWGGKKVRIPLEDDAIVTERGVEWLYPVNNRILLIGS
ncbi:MAG TPA: M24 family metallopeptidase [Vicinamibacterales bacterium]|nr:M24 family metallopeptidase [Vicinamibacterales bacterium]